MNQYAAEAIGTFWLVLGGCGSALLAAAFPNVGPGLLGVALAFGLALLTMAFVALFVGGWAVGQLWLFWVAPIAGAVLGAFTYRAVSEEG